MSNKEDTTKIAIEYLKELRDSRQKILPYDDAEKDADIFNMAIKALEYTPNRGCIECGSNCCLAEMRGEYCPTLERIKGAYDSER